MTTLIEAIQKLVAEIKSAEVPWRIAKLLPDLEQAIAQELASQKASANPVVSQKKTETVDKPVTITCGTCLHKPLPPHASPCDYCTTNFSNWEPKP